MVNKLLESLSRIKVVIRTEFRLDLVLPIGIAAYLIARWLAN